MGNGCFAVAALVSATEDLVHDYVYNVQRLFYHSSCPI